MVSKTIGNPSTKFKISRKAGDSTSLIFDPPLKSDALFDALREAFPDEANHQQRHRRAVIEFFQSELEEESQSSDFSGTTPDIKIGANGPFKQGFSQTASPLKRSSLVAHANLLPPAKSHTDSDRDKRQAMMIDFSIPLPGKKPRTPRKPMNEKRRQEFRVTKKEGACEYHRKRKKLCDCYFQNQDVDDMPDHPSDKNPAFLNAIVGDTTSTSFGDKSETGHFSNHNKWDYFQPELLSSANSSCPASNLAFSTSTEPPSASALGSYSFTDFQLGNTHEQSPFNDLSCDFVVQDSVDFSTTSTESATQSDFAEPLLGLSNMAYSAAARFPETTYRVGNERFPVGGTKGFINPHFLQNETPSSPSSIGVNPHIPNLVDGFLTGFQPWNTDFENPTHLHDPAQTNDSDTVQHSTSSRSISTGASGNDISFSPPASYAVGQQGGMDEFRNDALNYNWRDPIEITYSTNQDSNPMASESTPPYSRMHNYRSINTIPSSETTTNSRMENVRPSRSPSWTWDENRRKYYVYSESEHSWVYQDGERIPCGAKLHEQTPDISSHGGEGRGWPNYLNDTPSSSHNTLPKECNESEGRVSTPSQDTTLPIKRSTKKFFRVGKVIKILWPELPGHATEGMTVFSDQRFRNEKFVSKIRWFVVVKEGKTSCTCLPIYTYGKRGFTKPNITKWQHEIVYTGKEKPHPPDRRSSWLSIECKPRGTKNNSTADTRNNFAKIYTVEHNVKLYGLGEGKRPQGKD